MATWGFVMVLLNVFILNQFSSVYGKAELLVEEGDDSTEAVPCSLDHVEGFVGSKEHACVECIPSDKGQLGSSALVCFLLVFHSEWEMGVRLWRRAGCYVGRWVEGREECRL